VDTRFLALAFSVAAFGFGFFVAMQYEYRRSIHGAVLVGALLGASATTAQVIPTGSLRNTMWNGQQAGIIAMDSLLLPGMYGLGPLEYLRGEITVLDVKPIVSFMADDTTVIVEQRPDAKAPFFVRQQVKKWAAFGLPAEVVDLPSLDAFLLKHQAHKEEPFFFRLHGTVRDAEAHVMDLPPGTVLEGPALAHATQKTFTVRDAEVELVGVFSTKHQAVFTHHGSNIHVHLIAADGSLMGHLDRLRLDPSQMQLQVAEE
jgi:acetolactate decarboxylase